MRCRTLALPLTAAVFALAWAPRAILAQSHPPVSQPAGPSGDSVAPTERLPVEARAAYAHDAMAPTARAVRTTAPIVIDGVLDEPIWLSAPPINEFFQANPDEGAPVTEATEVRLLYDDDFIYVGAWLWDEGEVQTRLGRKDGTLPDADFFVVLFDSYHDHRTAYRFGTWPSGVKKDQIIVAGGGLEDTSWEPVWDLKTTITEEGWFVEMRIPFSQLRYRASDVQRWGFQAERRLRRKAEDAAWAFTPRSEPGGVARYGHLEGIDGIGQGKRLELLPFVTARAEYLEIGRSESVAFGNPFRSGSDYFANAGVDLKYRVGTNFTLDGAVNPDFGQLERDPAVINLTAFETRFDERRPFFVEGAEIFRFGDLGGRPGGSEAQLVYSRRIGREPQGALPADAEYSDVPTSSTILGAVKLSGKTAGNWSLGLLDAVTDRIEAPWINKDGSRGETVVEPRSNYLAARVRRDIRQGTGSFGALLTAVNRDLGSKEDGLESRLRSSAYSLGVDGRIEWNSQQWMVAAKLSTSRVEGSAEAITRTQQSSARYMGRPDAKHLELDSDAMSLSGFYGKLDLIKQAGVWRGEAGVAAISPGYEVNDLGFQSWADRVALTSNFGYEKPTVGQHFRSLRVTTGTSGMVNFGGEALAAEASVSFSAQHASFNSFNASVSRRFATWNDRLTRGGPLTREPAGFSARIGFSTDQRRAVQLQTGFQLEGDDGGGWARSADLGFGVRFLEGYEIQVGMNVDREHVAAQHVTSVTDPAATHTFGQRYVFAPLSQTTVGVETRLNVTFSPNLTFELYAQPFVSSGDYRDLMELARPRTFEFLRYGTDVGAVARRDDGRFVVDPDGTGLSTFDISPLDFNFRSLLGNAVLRWEWRSGSTLFLVWQQSRSERFLGGGTLLATEESRSRFDLERDTRALFRLKPDNIFMLKITYWLNP